MHPEQPGPGRTAHGEAAGLDWRLAGGIRAYRRVCGHQVITGGGQSAPAAVFPYVSWILHLIEPAYLSRHPTSASRYKLIFLVIIKIIITLNIWIIIIFIIYNQNYSTIRLLELNELLILLLLLPPLLAIRTIIIVIIIELLKWLKVPVLWWWVGYWDE